MTLDEDQSSDITFCHFYPHGSSQCFRAELPLCVSILKIYFARALSDVHSTRIRARLQQHLVAVNYLGRRRLLIITVYLVASRGSRTLNSTNQSEKPKAPSHRLLFHQEPCAVGCPFSTSDDLFNLQNCWQL